MSWRLGQGCWRNKANCFERKSMERADKSRQVPVGLGQKKLCQPTPLNPDFIQGSYCR